MTVTSPFNSLNRAETGSEAFAAFAHGDRLTGPVNAIVDAVVRLTTEQAGDLEVFRSVPATSSTTGVVVARVGTDAESIVAATHVTAAKNFDVRWALQTRHLSSPWVKAA